MCTPKFDRKGSFYLLIDLRFPHWSSDKVTLEDTLIDGELVRNSSPPTMEVSVS